MEDDDDEFGDLYSDVLPPFASSSPPPISAAVELPKPAQQQHMQLTDVDLNPTKETDADFIDNDVKFDIEEDEENEENNEIPSLFTDAGGGGGHGDGVEASRRIDDRGEGDDDDWDSDSEDDLQIVLNDNNSLMTTVDDGGGGEDGGLNIMAGGDPNQDAAGEEKEWGENTTQLVDGERKDLIGESSKAIGVPLKIGFSHQGYHPFKYVRPGATPMPVATTTPGVPPGQIRPLANMNPMAGRGRGEWRPTGIKGAAAMQTSFHAGRGFGGGLEFTLPSHKTIFEVDIDSFEDKPWKYPGVDLSVFFNFDLNEDSWKDYCKQLEQLRLESTMQSKIRVYESGRREQDYDPDLPPELAAATGTHDAPVENANSVRSDVGQSDLIKCSARMRPPTFPTGRAIQVESGHGDRLPSIDTRPPRSRDSDAIIEIVLQDTPDDDSSAEIDVQDQPEDGKPQKEDSTDDDHVVGDETPRLEPEYFDGFPQDYKGRKGELADRRMPLMNSSPAHMPDVDENSPFPQEETIDSRCRTARSYSMVYGGNFRVQTEGRVHGQSPSQGMAIVDNQKESVERMDSKHNSLLSSPVIMGARESSVENKDAELEETEAADGSSILEKEDIDLNTVGKRDTLKDEVEKREKLTSQVEHPLLDEGNGWENSKAACSGNSEARPASSQDYQKQLEGFEVVQDPRSVHLISTRKQHDENEQVFHRRDHDRRQEPERNHMVRKSREESYPYKDWHPSSAHQLHTKVDGFDRNKDRDSSNMDWARREDDLISKRVRNDDPRKRDKGKVRGNERIDKDDDLHSRKESDNGSYRVPYDMEPGVLKNREKGDGLKGKHEAVEDFHSKRRKDDGYLRREHIDKEKILHGYRQNANRHRRGERNEVDLHDHQRSRVDDQYAAKQKDEAWLLRERSSRQRDREEWHRGKQSHEEQPSKRETEGWSSVRSGRGAEEKTWVGHVRAKDEQKVSGKDYQSREAIQHSDQLKRRDRIQGESSHHKGSDEANVHGNQYNSEERIPHHKGRYDAFAHGNQYISEERRSRQERSSSRSGRVAIASDNQVVNERKRKEGSRKSKEHVGSTLSSIYMSKRSQENRSGGQIDEKGLKGAGDEKHLEDEIQGHHLSRKHRKDISTDDEQQDFQGGHSKLERWTSHKERDFSIGSKSSSSLKIKDVDKDNNDGSFEDGKPTDEYAKIVDADNQQLSSVEGKEFADMESKNDDTKGFGDQHLDTVEKLKKRSERFKLPMPSEKEVLVIKKLEREPLPSAAKSENQADSEVKQERPPRKRRWITN
ncbi:PREDICTED: FIP1[V]-like protein isoform X1 [Lupinus angustifolius]|uniref:FIP1[V]-like protein isoform X1 n=1 Tax=Lupinus angustifolius TaxID=3871 RepID=UPI00092F47FC|nr:PREDICTED: FIP1[V]-like protein isoform X1 [Lupinus angustifolius]